MLEHVEVRAQVLQLVARRVDRVFYAFFRRRREGQMPGHPRFHGSNPYTSFPNAHFANGARLDIGSPMFSKIGRVALRWPRHVGHPKTVTLSPEADGWCARTS